MSARITFKVSDEVHEVLARSTITATSVKLPDGQLDRKLYEAVNKVLLAAGGKWDRKSGTHKFTSDPREAMGLAVEKGEAVNHKTRLQAFYTPRPLAERVAVAVKLKHGYRVLEPSAGGGALVEAAMHIAAVDVDAYDIDPGVQDRLSAIGVGQAALTGGSLAVRIQDFLAVEPTPVYDAVVMNPPFSGGQDTAHVTHAIGFLKPGGRLAAIMWPGWQTANTKAAKAFRALLATMAEHKVEDIPAGSFEDTGVATVLLTLRR
jgi:type I restriction-modification system DNA methylase subunit